MLNFRVKPEELQQIDAAATQAGMSRSDWIRWCIHSNIGATPVVVSTPSQKVACTTIGPKCPNANWTRLLTGVQACLTCGAKR